MDLKKVLWSFFITAVLSITTGANRTDKEELQLFNCMYTHLHKTVSGLTCLVNEKDVRSFAPKFLEHTQKLVNITSFKLQFVDQPLQNGDDHVPTSIEWSNIQYFFLYVTASKSLIDFSHDNCKAIRSLLQSFKGLKYLHFEDTDKLQLTLNNHVELLSSVDTTNLRVLNLPHTQSHYGKVDNHFNLTLLQNNLRNPHRLQVLNISRNSLTKISGQLCPYFPSLKILDASYNYFLNYDSLFYEIIVHPYLEFANVGTQVGCVENEKNHWINEEDFNILQIPTDELDQRSCSDASKFMTPKSQKFQNGLLIQITASLLEWYGQHCLHNLEQCMQRTLSLVNKSLPPDFYNNNSTLINTTVNSLLIDWLFPTINSSTSILSHSSLCKFLQPLLVNYPVPCSYFPDVDTIISKWLDRKYFIPIQWPFLTNMRQLHLDNIPLGYNKEVILNYKTVNTSKPLIGLAKSPLNQITFSGNSQFAPLHMENSANFKNRIVFDLHFPNLSLVDLSKNEMTDSNLVNFLQLVSSGNVKILSLNDNFLQFENKTAKKLCGYNPFLKYLDVSRNRISEKISFKEFDSCLHLERLDLSFNKLKSFTFEHANVEFNKQHMNYNNELLENHPLELNLSNNELRVLNKHQLNSFDNYNSHTKLLQLDFMGNPLSCGCDNLQFLSWMKSTSVKLMNYNLYRCDSGMLVKHMNLKDLENHCKDKTLFLILVTIGTTIGIGVTLTLITYTIYQNRFRLHTWYLRRQGQRNSDTPSDQNFVYDAYLAYAAEDRFWTHDLLVKTLEDKFGFRLCVHYRDFPVGGYTIDAIDDAMKKSKAVILIVTKQALKKHWFIYEYNYARHMMVTERNNACRIIVILLEEIPKNLMDNTLPNTFETQVVLTWPDNSDIDTINEREAEIPDEDNMNTRRLDIGNQYTGTQGHQTPGNRTSSLENPEVGPSQRNCVQLEVQSNSRARKQVQVSHGAHDIFWYKLRNALQQILNPAEDSNCSLFRFFDRRSRPNAQCIREFADSEQNILMSSQINTVTEPLLQSMILHYN